MDTINNALMAEVLERNSRKIQGQTVTCDEQTPADQEALIRCLVDSTQSVFSTMCGMKLVAQAQTKQDDASERYQISGIIGLSGSIKATIVVSIHEDLVFSAAETFLGVRPDKIDADVIDLVGELANMIGGNAKERMKMDGLNLGLPTVVAGEGHRVAYNSGMAITVLPFKSDYGPLSIELGII